MLRLIHPRNPESERGATAVLVALCLVLLLGMAAVAIDLGFGFNERRQSQTAADMAVMAGATEIVLGGTEEEVVEAVLTYARANVDIEYSDDEWRELWMSCTDPDRFAFDVGGSVPVDFQPMPAPAEWGGGELDCISRVGSFLRVRIPDQVIDTTFARVMGFDEITTSASAVARVDAGEGLGAIVPFGIDATTPNGEICVSTGPTGHLSGPCEKNDRGSFGEIQSPWFGDYWGSPSCKNPSADNTLPRNVALGLDHAVSRWPAEMAALEGVTYGSPYPGNKTDVEGYAGIGLDDCKLVDGVARPKRDGDVTPPNALLMQSGFSGKDVLDGLILGNKADFLGQDPRLLRLADVNQYRLVESKGKQFRVDNMGLWDFLNHTNGIPGVLQCNGSYYTSSMTIEQKVDSMHVCLANYPAHATQDLFTEEIQKSARLVWAPEFWHQSSGSESYQPVYAFRLIFLSGLYFKDIEDPLYPDAASTGSGVYCIPQGSGCKNNDLSLVGMSAFLIPTEAVPESARPPVPGEPTAFTASLIR